MLKTDHGLDGDSLSYLDMMERNSQEDRRRARERQLMDEGKYVQQSTFGVLSVMYFQIDFWMCQHFYLDNVGDQISSSFAYLVWLYFFHTSKGCFAFFVFLSVHCSGFLRTMWETKRAEEMELAARDMEEVNTPMEVPSDKHKSYPNHFSR